MRQRPLYPTSRRAAVRVAALAFLRLPLPPARDTWYTLIHSILNPMTRSEVADWQPLIAALTSGDSGSVAKKYFVLVLFFFAAAVVSVMLRPKGADAPMVAVAAVMLATAF